MAIFEILVILYKHKVKGILFSKETGKKLIKIAKTPIVRFKKIKSSMRVHAGDNETIEYWKKRVFMNAFTQIYSVQVLKMSNRHKEETKSLRRCLIKSEGSVCL